MDLKIALAQINFTVGDISGNAEKIINNISKAKNENTDIILFPELALCGYPPLDLILEDEFINENNKKIYRDHRSGKTASQVVLWVLDLPD